MPNLSKTRLAELEAAERELQRQKHERIMQPFADELGRCLGIYLAATPFAAWPVEAQTAFKAAAREYPVGAKLYKDSLPKEFVADGEAIVKLLES